jgi:hypothetical protein
MTWPVLAQLKKGAMSRRRYGLGELSLKKSTGSGVAPFLFESKNWRQITGAAAYSVESVLPAQR